MSMRRIAVFVDAGYFFARAIASIHGKPESRQSIKIDYSLLREHLLEEVRTQFPDCDFLRVYWYDAPSTNQRSDTQDAIDLLDDFKLRLGTRNLAGVQKGVDGLLMADLFNLAINKSITHSLIVSGDGDLTPGVIATQSMGLRVHVLSLGSNPNLSSTLSAEVDVKRNWSDEKLRIFCSKNSSLPSQSTSVIPESAPTIPPVQIGGEETAAPDLDPARPTQPSKAKEESQGDAPKANSPGTAQQPPPPAKAIVLDSARLDALQDKFKRQPPAGEKGQLRETIKRLDPKPLVNEDEATLRIPLKSIAELTLAALEEDEDRWRFVLEMRTQPPSRKLHAAIDAALLLRSRSEYGRDLDFEEKVTLRSEFKAAVTAFFGANPQYSRH